MISMNEKLKLNFRIFKNKTLGLVVLNLLTFLISVSLFSGASITILALIPMQPLIIYFNYFLTKDKLSLCLYNLELLIFSSLGFLLNCLLYFKYVAYDTEGVLVMYFLLEIGALCIIISSVIAIIARIVKQKKSISK